MSDEFQTLSGISQGYYMDRGSKFLAFAAPAHNEAECDSFLSQIKKDHPKARHYCTALRLHNNPAIERSNDDGEPSGTAGKPILGQMIKFGLTNAIVVVVRYFGGTKLGVQGLTEAYKTAAANAIQAGTFVRRRLHVTLQLTLSYELLPTLVNHFRQEGIPIFKEIYLDRPYMIIGLKKSNYREELSASFHRFTKMDFSSLEEYLHYLNVEMENLNEEKII